MKWLIELQIALQFEFCYIYASIEMRIYFFWQVLRLQFSMRFLFLKFIFFCIIHLKQAINHDQHKIHDQLFPADLMHEFILEKENIYTNLNDFSNSQKSNKLKCRTIKNNKRVSTTICNYLQVVVINM